MSHIVGPHVSMPTTMRGSRDRSSQIGGRRDGRNELGMAMGHTKFPLSPGFRRPLEVGQRWRRESRRRRTRHESQPLQPWRGNWIGETRELHQRWTQAHGPMRGSKELVKPASPPWTTESQLVPGPGASTIIHRYRHPVTHDPACRQCSTRPFRRGERAAACGLPCWRCLDSLATRLFVQESLHLGCSGRVGIPLIKFGRGRSSHLLQLP
jgi:hypothetical protein